MKKTYRLRETSTEAQAALSAHPELLRDLLYARGITDAEAAAAFLHPDFERDSNDPFLLPDMEAAVERLRAAAREGELICVWSDYDCDGIPGGVMLAEFLRAIGCQVIHYIPHRHEEGYGLNEEGLSELAQKGVRLVVTVDLGISEHAHALYAQTLGMKVIITDHHLPHAALPEALAVINPHREDSPYPFRELCGAGVAWKLVQAILSRERFGYPEGREKWLLDLVGFATLSDMVPLVGENRMLASYGLLVMRRARRPGVRALLRLLRIAPSALNEDDIGFMLAPRINAASRMERPETAARLLAAADEEEAAELAATLNRINDERKGVVASIVKEARRRLAESPTPSRVIVMGSPAWRPGVLGLVANSLMESEGRPVFLWGREGGEFLKGSCRSDGSINVVELMTAAREVFEGFGGHELAGGFSLREERAHELSAHVNRAYEARPQEGARTEITLDRELPLQEVPRALRDISALRPFGEGNRKPLFLFPGVSISKMRQFGKQQNHLELILSREAQSLSGVSFFSTPDSFEKKVSEGSSADIVGHVERDFRGRPRLRIVDIL